MARKNLEEGWMEMRRSFSKAAFVRSLQRLIPELQMSDVVPTLAGVRAQAVRPDGGMVDDFVTIKGPNSVHVCNAPSPAATASLEIGRAVADHVPEMRPHTTVAVQNPWSRSVDARQRILLPKGLGDAAIQVRQN